MELKPDNLKDLIYYRKLYDVVKFSVDAEIFSRISAPASVEEIADKMSMDVIFIERLLNVLAEHGYVETMDENGAIRYCNSAISETYLKKGSPSYIGDDVFDGPGTFEALRKYADKTPDDTDITKDYWTPEIINNIGAFALLGPVQSAVGAVDLSGRRKMLDIGGGHGLYSIFFTKKYPGLRSWVLDLPGVTGVTLENIKKYGAEDAVSVISGDFQDLKNAGTYDVIFVSNVTASYHELCRLLSDACDILDDGGMLVLRNYVSDAGAGDWSSLVVLERYSRRGKQGFSSAMLRSAMESCRLSNIKSVYKGDGIIIITGIKK